MKGSNELQKEIKFETKLRDLLAKYGFSLKDIINLLDPQSGRRATPAAVEKHLAVPARLNSTKALSTVKSSKQKAGIISF